MTPTRRPGLARIRLGAGLALVASGFLVCSLRQTLCLLFGAVLFAVFLRGVSDRVVGAALGSGLLVAKRLKGLDLVAVLKTRE